MNGLPGATARLGANLAPLRTERDTLASLSSHQANTPVMPSCECAKTVSDARGYPSWPGASMPDKLMQLLRSTAQRPALRRTVPAIQVRTTRKAFDSASKPSAISGIRHALSSNRARRFHVGPWTPSGLVASATARAWSIAPLMITWSGQSQFRNKTI